MNPMTIAVGYFHWHYGRAFRDVFVVWSNLAWYITHAFSIPLLLRTLFAPWKRIKEEYRRNGVEEFFESLVLNILSRFFGAIVRLAIVLTGLVVLVFWAIGIFITYLFWIAAPLVIPLMFLAGFGMLF